MKPERVYALVFASVYPHYVKKAETKGRTREELDACLRWPADAKDPLDG